MTDGQDNRPRRARGAPPDSPLPPAPATLIGHQVFKYSPDGKLLMTLGTAGGGRDADYFYQPNDVLVAPNGDIFVSEGHSSAEGSNARILKFDKTGKFLKSFGKLGKGPVSSINRTRWRWTRRAGCSSATAATTGSRSSIRTATTSPSGRSSAARAASPSIATTTSTSPIRNPARSTRRTGRGRAASASAAPGTASFIPLVYCPDRGRREPGHNTSAAEGVAVDRDGNIYGAEVGPRALKKYVKKK